MFVTVMDGDDKPVPHCAEFILLIEGSCKVGGILYSIIVRVQRVD